MRKRIQTSNSFSIKEKSMECFLSEERNRASCTDIKEEIIQ